MIEELQKGMLQIKAWAEYIKNNPLNK